MKGMCGGILSNAKAAFAFLRQYNELVPIWGIQKISELDEFIFFVKNPPELNSALQKNIEDDKKLLAASFCRACGYCLPCPAEIPIPMAARMEFLLNRMVAENFNTPEWHQNMQKINNCTNCNHCKKNCPYELDVPTLLKHHQTKYLEKFPSNAFLN
jgi:predicted aldo/keto reductase-like oxidoreductase